MSSIPRVINDLQLNYLIEMVKNKYIEDVTISNGQIIIKKNGQSFNYDNIKIDQTLSITGMAADSKAVGDTIDEVNKEINKSISDHSSNDTIHITSSERTDWNIAKSHADSAHAPSNAQPNQNAFSNVAIGSTTIAADSTTATLTLVGSNVVITPDATSDKVTIGITKNNVIDALGYTPPTINTTYDVATTSNNGLMSTAMVSKLNNISDGANKTTVDSSLSSTSTNPVQNKAVYTAINNIKGVPSCTTSNNGQFLRVVNGVATWSTISSAEGVGF